MACDIGQGNTSVCWMVRCRTSRSKFTAQPGWSFRLVRAESGWNTLDTNLTNDTNPTRWRDGDVAQRAENGLFGTDARDATCSVPSVRSKEKFVRARRARRPLC